MALMYWRHLKPLLLSLPLLLLPFVGTAQQLSRNDADLERAMVTGIAMGIPGMSVAIGVRDEVVWTGTAGYSDVLGKVPVKEKDRFGVGSITKTFVARVILQLVEEGKLDLENTATDYVELEVVGNVPNADRATLRQLLNHQSGVPTWEFEPSWIRKGRGNEMVLDHVWGKTETLEYATPQLTPARHDPGVRFAYSNTNYTLLGLVIEAVTGNDAAQEIRRRILEPLALKNTFLESFENIPEGYVHHYHYATPEFKRIAGVHAEFPEIRESLVESTAGNLSPEWTAGGIVASASDIARWARAIRDGELLGPEMRDEVFRYYPPQQPSTNGSQYLQGISRRADYFDGQTGYGHSGGTLGFTAMMYWLEDADVTVVLLTNVGGMHSGLRPSPVGLFYRQVLLPAVMRYLN